MTGRDAIAITNEYGPTGGEERGSANHQTKRNENPAPSVHINSVMSQKGNGRVAATVYTREALRVIEVRNVKRWIQNGSRRVEILKGISLSIPAGQFVAIVGA